MAYKSDHPLFRDLTDEEEVEFRKCVRNEYKPGDIIDPMWHPVYRDECQKISDEKFREEIKSLNKKLDVLRRPWKS